MVTNCPIRSTNQNCGNANPEIQTTRTHTWPKDASSNAKRANPDKVNTKSIARLDTDGSSEKAKRRSLQEHAFTKQISWKKKQPRIGKKSTNNGSRFEFNNYLMTKTIKMEYDHGLLKIISAYDDQIMVRGSWNKIWVWNRSYNLKQSCETNSGRPRVSAEELMIISGNLPEMVWFFPGLWKCFLHTT